jgi:nucleotide-binding universal stress UspA family protein
VQTRTFDVLVAVDGSAPSREALGWAVAFARRAGAVLTICSVVDPVRCFLATAGGASYDPGPMTATLEADARRFCSDGVARAATDDVAAHGVVLEGAPAVAIDAFARGSGADMIVLGTHSRTGLALGVLGSVTDAVLRASRVAVVTVRDGTVLLPSGPIVVALDDSDASAAAATVALKIARVAGSSLHPIHVKDGTSAISARFATLAARAAAAGVRCAPEIREGDVLTELLAGAGACGASLVATGTHGRGSLGRLLLGSIANGLIRTATSPVLAVHAKG